MIQHHKSRINFGLVFLLLMLSFSQFALGATYDVTSSQCTGAGSLVEAMGLANANPGTDTISLAAGLTIDAGGCPPLGPANSSDYVILEATRSVIIEGNGATIKGHQRWITAGGLDTPLTRCPGGSDLIVALTPGFINVGLYGQDNSAITVTIRNLTLHELDAVARINQAASLVIEDSRMERIIAVSQSCTTNAVYANKGANFSAYRTHWGTIVNFSSVILGVAPNAAISGENAGDLVIQECTFEQVRYAGSIGWSAPKGKTANIVSSIFSDSGGYFGGGDTLTNIVNSIWAYDTFNHPHEDERFVNSSSQPLKFIASTILYPDVVCGQTCQKEASGQGWIHRDSNSSEIQLVQSAIGVNFPDEPGSGKLLDESPYYNPSPGITADATTWIQPTIQQDAAALMSITNQPNLLTAAPGLPVLSFSGLEGRATPLEGTAAAPGLLVDAIDNAQCGQPNALLNPIDGSCIAKDAYGNPRVDGNGKRSIGAVQNTLAPTLGVNGVGDAFVDLGWSRPKDPAAGTISGYEVRYRPAGGPTWSTFTVAGADSLSTQVTGLTNGTLYEFQVDTLIGSTPGTQPSNIVSATPLGPIGAPVVTATSGDGTVSLSWSTPSSGGHTLSIYSILWRPVGTATFIGAAFAYAPNTSAVIGGLTNGTEYEFKVAANSTDAVTGAQGATTSTPYAVPTFDYASPVTIYENSLLSIIPVVSKLTGTPQYSLDSGSLPTGVSLNSTAGEISGSVSNGDAGTYNASIRLSQVGLPAALDVVAALEIKVLAGVPELELHYPDVDLPAGTTGVNVLPTVTGTLGGTLSFSLLPGNVLPDGLSIDPATGSLNGTPTTATDGWNYPDVEVVETRPGQSDRQRVSFVGIRIQPTLVYAPINGEVGDPVVSNPSMSPAVTTQTFAVTGGLMPDGLALNTSSGAITGTPTLSQGQSSSVTVTRTLTGGQTQSVSATVDIKVSTYTISLQYPRTTLQPGVPVTIQPVVSGLKGTPTYRLLSELPAGLTLDSSSGIVSGTTNSGNFNSQAAIEVMDTYKSQTGTLELDKAPPVPVPASSTYMLLILAMLLVWLGWRVLQQRRLRC